MTNIDVLIMGLCCNSFDSANVSIVKYSMQFPEHTLESYEAAARQGAGVIECDVTFTSDRQLVCRHDQCDLHTTTNIVTIPELNAMCTTPWAPGVAPTCCTSDFTLAEIKTLCAKMDSSGGDNATTAEEYAYGGTADWRTDLYASSAQYSCPEVPTHVESIELIHSFGVYFTPELKSPQVPMPYEGDFTQEDFALQMIQEYIDAGIPPSQVWPQSFNHEDVYFWISNTDFGDQAVALDEDERTNEEIDSLIANLTSNGVKIVAPPMQRLVEANPGTELLIRQSYYAEAARAAGLDIITWTLERAGPGLSGFYWDTLDNGDVELTEGDRFSLLEVLSQDVGILGIFSDWPATVTFYANCKGIGIRSGFSSEETNPPAEDGSSGASSRKSFMSSAFVFTMLMWCHDTISVAYAFLFVML